MAIIDPIPTDNSVWWCRHHGDNCSQDQHFPLPNTRVAVHADGECSICDIATYKHTPTSPYREAHLPPTSAIFVDSERTPQ